jgi:hypothetical protein
VLSSVPLLNQIADIRITIAVFINATGAASNDSSPCQQYVPDIKLPSISQQCAIVRLSPIQWFLRHCSQSAACRSGWPRSFFNSKLQLPLSSTKLSYHQLGTITVRNTVDELSRPVRPLPAMPGIISGLYSCVPSSNFRPFQWTSTNELCSTLVKRNAVFLGTIFVGAFATNMYELQLCVRGKQRH